MALRTFRLASLGLCLFVSSSLGGLIAETATDNCTSYSTIGVSTFCCNGICYDGSEIDTPGLCANFDSGCTDPLVPPTCGYNQVYSAIAEDTVDVGLGICYSPSGCTWQSFNYTWSCCDCPFGYTAIDTGCGLPFGYCVTCTDSDEELYYNSTSQSYECIVVSSITTSSTSSTASTTGSTTSTTLSSTSSTVSTTASTSSTISTTPSTSSTTSVTPSTTVPTTSTTLSLSSSTVSTTVSTSSTISTTPSTSSTTSSTPSTTGSTSSISSSTIAISTTTTVSSTTSNSSSQTTTAPSSSASPIQTCPAVAKEIETLVSDADSISTWLGAVCPTTDLDSAAITVLEDVYSVMKAIRSPGPGIFGNSFGAASAVLATISSFTIGAVALTGGAELLGIAESVSLWYERACEANTIIGATLTEADILLNNFISANCSPKVSRRFGGDFHLRSPHTRPLGGDASNNPCSEFVSYFPSDPSAPYVAVDICKQVDTLKSRDPTLESAIESLEQFCDYYEESGDASLNIAFVNMLAAIQAAEPYCASGVTSASSAYSSASWPGHSSNPCAPREF